MSYVNENVIYNSTHTVDVNKNGATNLRNVLVKITKIQNYLQMKIRDLNDFAFNYTAKIDWTAFETMKSEQYLEICYEEFHLHLVELLKQTVVPKQMLLRLETTESRCKIVFYEKSRIKSLIFLIIDLLVTDQTEIIDEMSRTIAQLKEANETVASQSRNLQRQSDEKASLLNVALTTNACLKNQFCTDVKTIEDTFTRTVYSVETKLCAKLDTLNRRHVKLLRDFDEVKKQYVIKSNAFGNALRQLEHVKRDNDKHCHTVDVLRNEINSLNFTKLQADRNAADLKQCIVNKDKEIDILNQRIVELKQDINEAALIIAQKTKTHDEIGKDLVQANTMLVNFNNQYDVMAKELDRLREVIVGKETTIRDQSVAFKKITGDFDKYKLEFNDEDIKTMRHELFLTKQRIEELEKQNREAAKINGLLTKKLANGDGFDTRNMNWIHPK